MKTMNTTGQLNINSQTILALLSIDPVCNNETVYSIYMSAAEDATSIQIMIRN